MVGVMHWLCLVPLLVETQKRPAVVLPPKIRQISFERTYCFGTCPVYRVTINADGTVLFKGVAHVIRKGVYKGKIEPEEFKRLATVTEKLGFFGMKTYYGLGMTDLPSQIITVVTDKGVRRVEEYGGGGPDGLWALQRLIDSLTFGIQTGQEGMKVQEYPEGQIDVRVRRSGAGKGKS
jgi:hypothetical protein